MTSDQYLVLERFSFEELDDLSASDRPRFLLLLALLRPTLAASGVASGSAAVAVGDGGDDLTTTTLIPTRSDDEGESQTAREPRNVSGTL